MFLLSQELSQSNIMTEKMKSLLILNIKFLLKSHCNELFNSYLYIMYVNKGVGLSSLNQIAKYKRSKENSKHWAQIFECAKSKAKGVISLKLHQINLHKVCVVKVSHMGSKI